MASLKGEIDRFSSVFSLYGPGTVGSWLCIVASVFVSWTLNAESRRRDTISNDFIAMLSMALVAAGHVFYLLLHSQQSDLFTNTSPEATLYASSVEAPLNVCETFSVVTLALFPIAGLRDHRWRAGAILGIAFLHSRQRQSFRAESGGYRGVGEQSGPPVSVQLFRGHGVDLRFSRNLSSSIYNKPDQILHREDAVRDVS